MKPVCGCQKSTAPVCEVRGQRCLHKGSQKSAASTVSEGVRGQRQEGSPAEQGEEPEGCMSEELQVVEQCGGNVASYIWKSFHTVSKWGDGTQAAPASHHTCTFPCEAAAVVEQLGILGRGEQS